MRLPLILPLTQERLIGERVVVKEIETFGNLSCQHVWADVGWVSQMVLCEQIVAQIRQRGGGTLLLRLVAI